MRYEVEFASRAAREFLRLDRPTQRRLQPLIDGLAEDPRPHGVQKLSGMDAYRLRVGDHRIVYRIDDVEAVVAVVRVAHRRDAYRGLT